MKAITINLALTRAATVFAAVLDASAFYFKPNLFWWDSMAPDETGTNEIVAR